MDRNDVIKEMIARGMDSGFENNPDHSEEEHVRTMLNRLADAIIDARKLEGHAIPAPIASLLIATAEARLCGFILAVLNADELPPH